MSIATQRSSSFDRAGELLAVGNAHHRVPGGDEQRPHPALAGRRDLLRHQRRRHRAEHLGEAADPRAPLAVAAGADQLGDPVEGDRRLAEHRAARGVEVAGRERERVEQEGDERAVAAQARPGAPVDRRSVRGRDVPGQLPDGVGRNAGLRLGPLGSELGDELPQPLSPVRPQRHRSGVLKRLGEDHLQQREQQERVGVGPQRDVLELARGLRAARIDHHDSPAAIGDRVQLVLDPRSAHHRSVRDERVRADDQQEISSSEVRDRQQERRAVEQRAGGEAVGDVLGGGGVVVRRAEPVEEALDPERVRVAERSRVAHVPADRVAAVLAPDRAEPLADLVERGLPGDALEAAVGSAPERMEDPIGVVLDLGHRDPLGAGEALRERVIGVGSELRHLAVVDRGDEAAERLADPAVGDVLGRAHDFPAQPTPAPPPPGPPRPQSARVEGCGPRPAEEVQRCGCSTGSTEREWATRRARRW